MAQVALAWVISKEGVTAPIIGSTSLDNLKDLIGQLSLNIKRPLALSANFLYRSGGR